MAVGPGALLLAAASSLAGCTGAPRPRVGSEDVPAISTAIKLDNFGYRPEDDKVAIFSDDPGTSVQVRTTSGKVAFAVPADGGSIRSKGEDPSSGDRIWWVDFTPLRARGQYELFSATLRARSYPFEIRPDVYGEVLRTTLKTFYRQRCGVAKPAAYAGAWADGTACHRADTVTAPGRGQRDRGVRDLSGGWHDAGDYNKYLWYAASNAILSLLAAWAEDDRRLFADGTLDIPESGNGRSDLLDEVKWELDFFLKMQLPDGSVLSQVRTEGDQSGASPPSADEARRFYRDPTLESGAVFAGSCALAARVFAEAGDAAYAATLRRAALAAWAWVHAQGDGNEKLWAAAEVFRLDPTVLSARRYVDSYRTAGWSRATFDLGATSYDAHAAFTYAETPGATPAVAAAMRASIGEHVDRIFAADDLYRNGMPPAAYHWGSNAMRAGLGLFLLQAARLGATGTHGVAECRGHALDMLHAFHGQNAMSMVYLTNMADRGGEHSSWQVFHNWFGQSGSAYSRSHFIGKPVSVAEPGYPYFAGADNHGVRDDAASAFGPAPGFVPGGPNRDYTGDAVPPAGGRHPARFYRDWNDQRVWTARSWEITETSIGYQGPYVALVAAFAQ